jgi:hypothetical protein
MLYRHAKMQKRSCKKNEISQLKHKVYNSIPKIVGKKDKIITIMDVLSPMPLRIELIIYI